MRGELTVHVVMLDDGTSQTEYYLRVGGDEQDERRLALKTAPDLPSGTRVKVWGVETEDQMTMLRLMGCNELQGYLLARPMSAADLETMDTHRHIRAA